MVSGKPVALSQHADSATTFQKMKTFNLFYILLTNSMPVFLSLNCIVTFFVLFFQFQPS